MKNINFTNTIIEFSCLFNFSMKGKSGLPETEVLKEKRITTFNFIK